MLTLKRVACAAWSTGHMFKYGIVCGEVEPPLLPGAIVFLFSNSHFGVNFVHWNSLHKVTFLEFYAGFCKN
jgi:hypothetical protein